MNYSTEYTAVIAMFLTPIASNYFSDACAGEVSGVVATAVVTGLAGLYLLIKRYKKGDVNALGFKK